ncbi:HEPN domain-containing protein [Stenotrophomonas muris]|uniref:HEPN domain-containing protein n=1 Tax=Stenotrophomonas muris TaxID=2963283 RepID=UPI0040410B56
MTTVSQFRADLGLEIDSLRDRFISPWMQVVPGHTPDQFEHDVKAFCVLAHAAFEEYAEQLSLLAMHSARDAWLQKRFSFSTIALLCSYGVSIKSEESDGKEQNRFYDQVREGFVDVLKLHSNVVANNHGFSRPYLRSLFTPVGVDIPEDALLLQSLRELAEARGSFAHSRASAAHYGRQRSAMRPMTPEKANTAVLACLSICDELGKRVEQVLGLPVASDSAPQVLPTPPETPCEAVADAVTSQTMEAEIATAPTPAVDTAGDVRAHSEPDKG